MFLVKCLLKDERNRTLTVGRECFVLVSDDLLGVGSSSSLGPSALVCSSGDTGAAGGFVVVDDVYVGGAGGDWIV